MSDVLMSASVGRNSILLYENMVKVTTTKNDWHPNVFLSKGTGLGVSDFFPHGHTNTTNFNYSDIGNVEIVVKETPITSERIRKFAKRNWITGFIFRLSIIGSGDVIFRGGGIESMRTFVKIANEINRRIK